MAATLGRILVTGGTGFVGSTLVPYLQARGRRVRVATRRRNGQADARGASEIVHVGSIGPHTDWRAALDGVTCVVHLAALAHVLDRPDERIAHRYFEVNTEGTLSLARAAADAGVRRLIFLSSVKVYGNDTNGRVFTETDPPRPDDAYGESKWRAEQGLQEIARKAGMEFVVLRAPLVYGPEAKANFARLIRFATRGIPLPLASIHNRRSLIGVRNLCAAIELAAEHSLARNETFVVDDGAPISTPDLIRRVACALGARVRLLPCPPTLLGRAARWVGRETDFARLTDDLVVSSARIQERLGYRPPQTLDHALIEVAGWFYSCDPAAAAEVGRFHPISDVDAQE